MDKMNGSRTRNAKRNIVNGMIREFISVVLAFVTRTMVLYILGEQYLGLSGLFTSILNVLNLAELGFNTAVIYFLYKPVAENDQQQICAITAYLRRVYHIIGFTILAGGLAVLPFLPNLISDSYPGDINIYILYIIYLLNASFSYWFCAYKSVLFTVMQRADIVSKIYMTVSFGTKLLQLLMLVLFRNYYLFALVMVTGTVANNLLLQYISRKMMPQIVPRGEISSELKASIGRQMRSIFIGKIGDVTRNSCDSIFLSAWFGLSVVASYDNYMYIYNALIGVIWMVNGAIQASVGNCMVKESLERNRDNFFSFDFMMNWFVSWCTVCLFCLYQPFVKIWMQGRENLILSNVNMMLICLYFYSIASCSVQNVYASGAGLFSQTRNWYILEAVSNIVLNTILGYFLGVTGIILATLLSVVACNFAARSRILFRWYFKTSAAEFYKGHVLYFGVLVCGGLLTALVCSLVKEEGLVGLILRMAVCVVVPNAVFSALHWKNRRFRDCVVLVKEIIRTK